MHVCLFVCLFACLFVLSLAQPRSGRVRPRPQGGGGSQSGESSGKEPPRSHNTQSRPLQVERGRSPQLGPNPGHLVSGDYPTDLAANPPNPSGLVDKGEWLHRCSEEIVHPAAAARPQWPHPWFGLAAVWLSRRGCCPSASCTCCAWTSPSRRKKSGTRRSSTSPTWIPSAPRSGWRRASAGGTGSTPPRGRSRVWCWCRPSPRTDRLAIRTSGSPPCPRRPPGWLWWPRGTAPSGTRSGTSQTWTPLRWSSTTWAPGAPTTPSPCPTQVGHHHLEPLLVSEHPVRVDSGGFQWQTGFRSCRPRHPRGHLRKK